MADITTVFSDTINTSWNAKTYLAYLSDDVFVHSNSANSTAHRYNGSSYDSGTTSSPPGIVTDIATIHIRGLTFLRVIGSSNLSVRCLIATVNPTTLDITYSSEITMLSNEYNVSVTELSEGRFAIASGDGDIFIVEESGGLPVLKETYNDPDVSAGPAIFASIDSNEPGSFWVWWNVEGTFLKGSKYFITGDTISRTYDLLFLESTLALGFGITNHVIDSNRDLIFYRRSPSDIYAAVVTDESGSLVLSYKSASKLNNLGVLWDYTNTLDSIKVADNWYNLSYVSPSPYPAFIISIELIGDAVSVVQEISVPEATSYGTIHMDNYVENSITQYDHTIVSIRTTGYETGIIEYDGYSDMSLVTSSVILPNYFVGKSVSGTSGITVSSKSSSVVTTNTVNNSKIIVNSKNNSSIM